MEDILASIRKIIAEDPPGSRAAPDPARESLLRANAPVAPSSPARQVIKQTPRPIEAAASGASAEHEFQADAAVQRDVKPSQLPERKPPTDIEDQMAQILGAARRLGEPAQEPLSRPQASVQAAIDSLMTSRDVEPKRDATPRFTHQRDGFIPSVPEVAPAASAAPPSAGDPFDFALGPSPFARAKSADPQSAPPPAADLSFDAAMADLGAIVPSRHMGAGSTPAAAAPSVASALEARAPAPDPVPAPELAAVVAAAAETVAPVRTTEMSAAADASIGPTAKPVAALAASPDEMVLERPLADPVKPAEAVRPSIFATIDAARGGQTTIAPHAQPASAPVSVVTAPEPASAQVFVQPSIPAPAATFDDAPELPAAVTEAVAPAPEPAPATLATADVPIEPGPVIMSIEEPRADAGVERWPSSPAMSPSRALMQSRFEDAVDGVPANRTMEDTVAELLRPMLKNWLAENMPKIVERALRKELDDTNRSGHKTAAE